MVDMYKALVATSRWEQERQWGFRVTLVIRPLTMFMDNRRTQSLLQFGNKWQDKMRACGIECRNAEVVPCNAYSSDYIIRILAIMKFSASEWSSPTVWFALSMS